MAVRHNDPGADLTQDEFINIGHQLTDQAAGDIIYATDGTTLSRLPAPENDSFFRMSSTGVPSYENEIPAVNIGELPASKVTSGEFDADRIPVLDAGKVTSGEFSIAQIPDIPHTKIPALPGMIHVSTAAPGSEDWEPGDIWFQRDA